MICPCWPRPAFRSPTMPSLQCAPGPPIASTTWVWTDCSPFFRLELLYDAQVLCDQRLVSPDFCNASREGDPTRIQDHDLVCQIESELDVLLDQDDGVAFLL